MIRRGLEMDLLLPFETTVNKSWATIGTELAELKAEMIKGHKEDTAEPLLFRSLA